MKTYTIRNEHGTMIGKVNKTIANTIIDGACGFWRTYKTDKLVSRCFVITADSKFGADDSLNLVVYLWKGYIIIEDELFA